MPKITRVRTIRTRRNGGWLIVKAEHGAARVRRCEAEDRRADGTVVRPSCASP